jgi:two-component system OmpR family response regulator
MRIFLADDDVEYRSRIASLLTRTGLTVERVATAQDLKDQLAREEMALVLVGLPPEGFDHALLLRDVVQGRPCIILAADDHEAERITALELGADDVIAKRAPPREIVARVRSVLRRVETAARWGSETSDRAGPPFSAMHDPACRHTGSRRPEFHGPGLQVAASQDWAFLVERRELLRPDGSHVPLTTAEFRLLEVLVRQQGEVVGRERLFTEVFDRNFHPFDRAIDTLVAKLRGKLSDDPRHPGAIRTVRPVGYMFIGFPAL